MQRFVRHFIAFLQVNPNLQHKLLHETYETENVLFDFTATGIVYSE